MSEHSATDSPYTFRDRSARRLTRKQQESIESERSAQATPCRKRKRLSDDSAFGDSGAETEVEAPPASRQRTTQDVWVEIDESDHSHPSPFEPSVQLSPEIQQWENMLQALQGSTPLRWTASDESRVDRAFAELVEVVGILPLPASISRSIPASLREKFPQGKQGINHVEWECLSIPPLASKSTRSEPRLDMDQWISIPGESTGSVDGCGCGWLEMCGEPIKIGIDEKHIWNQNRCLSFRDSDVQVWSLHDIDLSGKDPDLESGKPLPPTVGDREIEEALEESLARFEKNRANLKSLRNDMEVDHRCIIANDAYREGVILEQKQLDDGTCPGYSNGFWTLPKPVLRNLEWQKVLDEDEARDGKPSKTFIKASKSIKRKNVTLLTAFEDVTYRDEAPSFDEWLSHITDDHSKEMVKQFSVEQDQQDVRGGDELGSSCLAFGGGVDGELSSRQLLFEDCDASWDEGMKEIENSNLW